MRLLGSSSPPGAPPGQALADLCRQPTFITDLFCNYDCDLRSPNLFARTSSLLCKSAFPVSGPMMATHTVALEALLAALAVLAERSPGPEQQTAIEPPPPLADPASFDPAIWEDPPGPAREAAAAAAAGDLRVRCALSHPPALATPGLSPPQTHRPPANVGADAPPRHATPLHPTPPQTCALHLRQLKFLKERTAVGADHFNRDAKKGVQFLTTISLLPQEPSCAAMASFLRFGFGLDKTAIGDYLGEKDAFAVATLDHFATLFDFKARASDGAPGALRRLPERALSRGVGETRWRRGAEIRSYQCSPAGVRRGSRWSAP